MSGTGPNYRFNTRANGFTSDGTAYAMCQILPSECGLGNIVFVVLQVAQSFHIFVQPIGTKANLDHF